jgi:hypothetical protein
MSGPAKTATLAIKKGLRLCSKETGGEPGKYSSGPGMALM